MNNSKTVSPEDSGLRLDSWLALAISKTRSQAQRLIREGLVRINNVVETKPGAGLKPGMIVSWDLLEVPRVAHAPPKIDVLYEDDALLVVNKPAGIIVHPGGGTHSGTIMDSIIARMPDSDVERGGLVHRLDKETSGVLVVAKSSEALHALQTQWRSRQVTKEYIALVVGILTPKTGTIEAPIARHHVDRKRMHIDTAGKEATTHYMVKQYYKHFTLLNLELVTGRTHQIRVHLSAIGFPVAGDRVYGDQTANEVLALQGLKRQFLHAQQISFKHPTTGKTITVKSPLPDELQKVLDVLE